MCNDAVAEIVETRRMIRSLERIYEDAKRDDDYDRARQAHERIQNELDHLESLFSKVGISSPVCKIPANVEQEFYDAINLLHKYRPTKFKR